MKVDVHNIPPKKTVGDVNSFATKNLNNPHDVSEDIQISFGRSSQRADSSLQGSEGIDSASGIHASIRFLCPLAAKPFLEQDGEIWDGNQLSIRRGQKSISNSDGNPHNPTTLPYKYKLIRGLRNIDSWRVGVILYSLISGDNGNDLFKVDNKDDLDENDVITLASWKQEMITRTIKKHSVFYEILDSDCDLIRMSGDARMMLRLNC